MAIHIQLGDGKMAVVEFHYDEKMMTHLRNAPDEPHLETKVKITILDGLKEVGAIEKSAWCSPEDRFSIVEGKVRAVRKAFKSADKQLLPKPYRELIARQIIVPYMQKRKEKIRQRINAIRELQSASRELGLH